MKTCINCGNNIPSWAIIDGKQRNLSSRKFCLKCRPYKTKKFIPTDRWKVTPDIIKRCFSYSDLIRAVGLDDRGNNHETVKKVIKYYDLDISHFGKLQSHLTLKTLPFEEIFCKNSKVNTKTIISKFKEFTEHKCSCCGLTEWNNMSITLQVDHKNGNRRDNRINNLRLLCPNCHSQTKTLGRKTKNYEKEILEDKTIKKCKICKNPIKQQQKYCSIRCMRKDIKIKRPNKDILKQEATVMSLRKVAQKYKVSDKMVRKWLCYYGIDLKKSFSGKTTTS